MRRNLAMYVLGLLLCLPALAAGQQCTAARQAYRRLLSPIRAADGVPPTAIVARIAARQGIQVQAFLTQQIRAQLEAAPAGNTALRVQKWLRCVQQDNLPSEESNAPWAAALDTAGREIAVAEYIRLGAYASFSRAYLQIWFKNPGQGWQNTLWDRPGTSFATFHAWTLRSPVSGERWFLTSAEAISADGNNSTRIDVVGWKQGQMRVVWGTPGEGVFHTRIVSVTPTRFILRSSFGLYAHRERILLRTFLLTPQGAEQEEAQFTYFPMRPPGAPARPRHLVPLTEPGPRGAPTRTGTDHVDR